MALNPGERLGTYEILAPIGAGGMGEVYRARDTKLGRDVAIKVLPEAFSHDEEKLARFQREAHLLASLNHPNVATLHGLEESEGQQFLVMELVEGETLAERIARGPIPVEEALLLFKQIADGLEAAHEKGVIHRDLKPANIKVSAEGKPKLLDFGLAKGALTGEVTNESPTVTREGTETGVILGTAAYMSPEQARGEHVDRRTDVWSFGCCLYEALTGKPAFGGATVTDILAAVVRAEPDWQNLPEAVPPSVRRLLLRCLTKGKSDRLQHIGDARLELREGLHESEVPLPESPRSLGGRRGYWLWGLVAVTVLAGGIWKFMRPNAPFTIGRPVRLALSIPEPVSLASRATVAVSPNGDEIAFVGSEAGESKAYLRKLSDLTVVPLPGTEDARDVFFSPDGEWVGFITGPGSLKKVALSGGAPLVLCEDCASPRNTGAWGTDGFLVFTLRTSYGLARVSADRGGTPEILTQPEEAGEHPAWHFAPQILPGSKAVLFTSISAGETQIAAVSLDTGEVRTIVEPGGSPFYIPTGHILYAVDDQILAVRFDPDTLEVEGTATPVLSGVDVDVQAGASYDVSRSGTLVYAANKRAELVWIDEDGTAVPTAAPPRDHSFPVISPDGRFVAVTLYEGFGRNIWVSDLERGTLTRLTFGGDDVFSLWTPDGERVVYTSGSRQGYNLFWTSGDGSGKAEALTTGNRRHKPTSWSPDGRTLLANVVEEGNTRVYELQMDRERALVPLLLHEFRNAEAVFSPDGHWIAYQSDESGRMEVYVRSYPGLEERQQVSVNGGTTPIWHPSGKALIFAAGSRLMIASISYEPRLRVDVPRLWIEMDQYAGYAGRFGRNYDLSPDGERILFVKSEPRTELNVVLNWFQELERLVPTN